MSSAAAVLPLTPFVRSVFLDAPSWEPAGLPAWFLKSRYDAWDTFTKLPFPGRREEAWRFADLKLLDFDQYYSSVSGEAGTSDFLKSPACRLVFVNDELREQTVFDFSVQVLTLKDALVQHAELMEQWATVPDPGLGSAKFASLHQAQLSDAVVIVVPEGVQLKQPVEIVHWLSGDQPAAFPRTILVTGKNAELTVLEHHLSGSAEGGGLSIGAAQLIAGEGSSLHYTLLNRQNRTSKSIHLSTVTSGPGAQVRHSLFNLGEGWTRTECRSLVAGEGSRSEMFSVSMASGNQEVDQRTLQDHLRRDSYSDLLYKNILFDTSRTIFAGLIKVDEGAHGTDAYQKCRNLLLSDTCEANSMPGLEINADQVKCSHGSTTGRIDEDELFYFASRGIPRATAARLIAVGFAQEVVSRLDNPEIEALVGRALEDRFAHQSP